MVRKLSLFEIEEEDLTLLHENYRQRRAKTSGPLKQIIFGQLYLADGVKQ